MKDRFIELLYSTRRKDIEQLTNYLENETDFFIAPASTNYHANYRGGLLEHSLNVYDNLDYLNRSFNNCIPTASVKIIGLLHDICKSNFYQNEIKSRKVKNEDGSFKLTPYGKAVWEDIEVYTVLDSLPLGHGEKSVIMLMKHIRLTDEEIFCIRWHMMSYDDVVRGYAGNLSLTNALNIYPSISLTHCADLLSLNYKVKE